MLPFFGPELIEALLGWIHHGSLTGEESPDKRQTLPRGVSDPPQKHTNIEPVSGSTADVIVYGVPEALLVLVTQFRFVDRS